MSYEEPIYLNQLIDQDAQRQEARATFELTQARFMLFLSERGIIFGSDEDLGSSIGIPQQWLPEPNELIWLGAENRLRVMHLTSMKMIVDTLQEQGQVDEIPTIAKKQLQAKTMIRGTEPAWLELIDIEFPGEPLLESDQDLLLRESLATRLSGGVQGAELDAADKEITEILNGLGKNDFTYQEKATIWVLGLWLSQLRQLDDPSYTLNAMERARIYVLKNSLDIKVWGQVIEHCFRGE